MATVGERVKYSIDHMERGEIYVAMEHACNAVDVTSQKYYGKASSSRGIFKDFIKEHHWLIEYMSLGGINLDETTFDNFPIIEGQSKAITQPCFADLMYHVVRCGLVHGDRLHQGFSFHSDCSVLLSGKHITFPSCIVWGLLATVIFCPCNTNEVTAANYWIGFHANRLVINDFWGNDEIARHLVSRYPMPRVTLKDLSFENA